MNILTGSGRQSEHLVLGDAETGFNLELAPPSDRNPRVKDNIPGTRACDVWIRNCLIDPVFAPLSCKGSIHIEIVALVGIRVDDITFVISCQKVSTNSFDSFWVWQFRIAKKPSTLMHWVTEVTSCVFLNLVDLAGDRLVIKVVVRNFSIQISM